MLIAALLDEAARRHGDREALIAGGERLTYAELNARANRLAHGLISRGLSPGDRAAIWLDNGVDVAVAVWAVLKAGAVMTPLNASLKAAKLTYILNDTRARLLITDPGRAARVEAGDTPHLSVVVTTADFAGLMSAHPASAPEARRASEDLAALIYTSGTTGEPKGVMCPNAAMLAAAGSIQAYLKLTAGDRVLNVLPLSHGYGLYHLFLCAGSGAALILEKSFAFPAQILGVIAKERATVFPAVPAMLAMLLGMDLSAFDLTSLRIVTSAGAALPSEHLKRLAEALPDAEIFAMYGLTECVRASFLPPAESAARPASIGRGMPGAVLEIIDETGAVIPGAGTGELVVRGAHVMAGYWEKPEETARVFLPGRAVRSGDLFRRDAEGFFYFAGRRDELIKSRGERVSPKEVEDVLCALPGVAEAAVVGAPDPVLGAVVKAVIVQAPGAALTEREVTRFCAQRLEDFAVPRLIEFRTALPLGPTGKVDKQALTLPAQSDQAA